MRKTFLAGLIVGVMILSMAGMSNADIINLDDDASGVGYFRDTLTGYTWIDVDNAHVGQSSNQIETALAGSIWQIATYDDLYPMLLQTVNDVSNPLKSNFDYWANIMGYLNGGGDISWIQGNYENGDAQKSSYAAAWAGNGDEAWSFVNPIPSNLPNYNNVPWDRNTTDSTIGAWILTKEQFSPTAPVPEPATMLLFGTGLVGMVGARIRKRKK